uniref:Uncharacterized protein n=1 Tax=Arundo donax TaxID=35708 RepID=A0A0A8Y503_ARUDO
MLLATNRGYDPIQVAFKQRNVRQELQKLLCMQWQDMEIDRSMHKGCRLHARRTMRLQP